MLKSKQPTTRKPTTRKPTTETTSNKIECSDAQLLKDIKELQVKLKQSENDVRNINQSKNLSQSLIKNINKHNENPRNKQIKRWEEGHEYIKRLFDSKSSITTNLNRSLYAKLKECEGDLSEKDYNDVRTALNWFRREYGENVKESNKLPLKEIILPLYLFAKFLDHSFELRKNINKDPMTSRYRKRIKGYNQVFSRNRKLVDEEPFNNKKIMFINLLYDTETLYKSNKNIKTDFMNFNPSDINKIKLNLIIINFEKILRVIQRDKNRKLIGDDTILDETKKEIIKYLTNSDKWWFVKGASVLSLITGKTEDHNKSGNHFENILSQYNKPKKTSKSRAPTPTRQQQKTTTTYKIGGTRKATRHTRKTKHKTKHKTKRRKSKNKKRIKHKTRKNK